jgi:hypothetical protein
VLDEREVAEVFLVPLSYVLDSANHQRDALVRNGKARSFYVLPYPVTASGVPPPACW